MIISIHMVYLKHGFLKRNKFTIIFYMILNLPDLLGVLSSFPE